MRLGQKMTLEQRKRVSEGHKGQVAWCKGTKGVVKGWNKGMRFPGKLIGTPFKKGMTPWNKGLKGYMGANATSFKKGSSGFNRPHSSQSKEKMRISSLKPKVIEAKRDARLKQRFLSPSKVQLRLYGHLKKVYPMIELEYPVNRWLLDMAIPESKIGIEFDGIYWHNTPERKAKDLEKELSLSLQGWYIIRYNETSLKLIEGMQNRTF